MKDKYKTIIDFFLSLPTNIQIDETQDEIKLEYFSEDKSAKTIFSIKEDDELMFINLTQSNSAGEFTLNWNYDINIDHSIILAKIQGDMMELVYNIQRKIMNDKINKILYGFG